MFHRVCGLPRANGGCVCKQEPLWRVVWLPMVVLAMLTGCAMRVPADRMYGTYVASYPFGTSTLALSRDGGFVQSATIGSERPVTVRGSWSFDPVRSKLALHGAMNIVDGYGHLSGDWHATGDFPAIPVEVLWLRINIETSEGYPYINQ